MDGKRQCAPAYSHCCNILKSHLFVFHPHRQVQIKIKRTSAPVEQVATPQIHQESRGSSESLTVTKVNSSKALLDQVRINAAYLREQDDGYWSANKMIRAVRWGRIERHSSSSKRSDAFEGSEGRFIGKPESFGSGAAMARFAR